jgi:hypothetical protein
MLFQEGKSSLVRLSDCIKVGIGAACESSLDWLELHATHATVLREMQRIGRDALAGKIPMELAEKLGKEQSAKIPHDDAVRAISLQFRLHSECLSVLLNVCFALESYINSYAYHLLQEKDFLGLLRATNDVTAELLFNAIDRLSTQEKWQTMGRLRDPQGFDGSKSPFQDLRILFNFRNDMVHDRVREYSDNFAKKRYNGKLPDPAFGFLDLRHAIYGAETYWNMVLEIHRLTSQPREDFHRHYNLSPWYSTGDATEARARDISRRYSAAQDV